MANRKRNISQGLGYDGTVLAGLRFSPESAVSISNLLACLNGLHLDVVVGSSGLLALVLSNMNDTNGKGGIDGPDVGDDLK